MSIEFYDTNAWVGLWPLAPLGHSDLATLRRHWRMHGIQGGFVSSLNALWLTNPHDHNARLIESSRKVTGVDPLPILNLLDPAWSDELAQLMTDPSVKAVRLAPGYGGWKINNRAAVEAAKEITAQGRRVVLTARLVDERQEHPAIKLKPVKAAAIARWIDKVPGMQPLVQGLSRWELEELAKSTESFLTDLSFFEWDDSLGVLAKVVDLKRAVFGSLTPFHVTQAHMNKITASPSASLSRRKAVAAGNALRWLKS